MIYSSKQVINPIPPVTTYAFQPIIVVEEEGEDGIRSSKTQYCEDIVFLGKIDDTYYHYVPDEVVLADQPQEAEVTKLDSLSPEIEQQLITNGNYAVNTRYSDAVQNVLPLGRVNEERNLVNVWQAISDISVILAQLLEQTPMKIDENSNVNIALNTIKKFKAKSDALQQQLQNIGL